MLCRVNVEGKLHHISSLCLLTQKADIGQTALWLQYGLQQHRGHSWEASHKGILDGGFSGVPLPNINSKFQSTEMIL